MNERLSSLDHDVKRPVQGVKFHSLVIKAMRYLLPVVLIVLLLMTLIVPQVKEYMTVVIPASNMIEADIALGQAELIKPNFETLDKNKNPIKVTADKAIQNSQNDKLIELKKPNANLIMNNGAAVHVTSDDGVYEQEKEKLLLKNNVNITHEDGYVLSAQEIKLDMDKQSAFSDQDVKIIHDDGEIRATGMEGQMKEGLLVFKGPAKLIWNEKNQNKETKAEAENE